jgi:hypothetical protein
MKNLQSVGKCLTCGDLFPKSGITRHLVKCVPVQSGRRTLLHLVADQGPYFIHIEAHDRATLGDLDEYLRQIWLECCGHLSSFRMGKASYEFGPSGEPADGHRDPPLIDVLRLKDPVAYDYDFGSTTSLTIRMVGFRTGSPDKSPVRLLARNEPPRAECQECGKPAIQICAECVYSGPGTLCARCGKTHECGEEMVMPFPNSPRAGVCGYSGSE